MIVTIFNLTSCKSFKAWVAKEFMQGTVAEGLARLSAQHLSIIMSEINEKFEKDDSIVAKITDIPISDDQALKRGEAVWSIKDGEIYYPEETEVFEGCPRGEPTTSKAYWKGKVKILSATRTIKGHKTKNPKNPIIPDYTTHKYPVSLDIHVIVENLKIKFSDKKEYLLFKNAELMYQAYPRLAQTRDVALAGLRIAPTSNTRFKNVRIINAKGRLHSDQVEMDVTIENSDLKIQVGKGEDGKENYLSGKIAIMGTGDRKVPMHNKTLDPDYDAEAFVKTFWCFEGLDDKPVTYENKSFEEVISSSAAGISTKAISAVLGAIEDDAICGMASDTVLRSTEFSDAAGTYGVVTNNMGRCEIDFKNYRTKENCFGEAQELNGKVIVNSAQKSINGLIASNKDAIEKALVAHNDRIKKLTAEGKRFISLKPTTVIPNDMQPVEFKVDIDFDNFSMKDIFLKEEGSTDHESHCSKLSDDDINKKSITYKIKSGNAKAKFKPVLAKQEQKNADTAGICSEQIPVAEGKIKLNNMCSKLAMDGNKFSLNLKGEIEILSGKLGGRENELKGSFTVDQKTVQFNSADKLASNLDPFYKRDIYADSYMSCKELAVPKVRDDCKLEPVFAENLSRLLTMSTGGMTKSVANETASFSGVVNGELSNNNKKITFKRAEIHDPAYISATNIKSANRDNNNDIMKIKGSLLNMDSKLSMRGKDLSKHDKTRWFQDHVPLFKKSVYGLSAWWNSKNELSVRPDSPTSSKIKYSTDVDNFSTKIKKANGSKMPYMKISEGSFAVKATPYMGVDTRTQRDSMGPSYTIETPIIRFNEISVGNVSAVLRIDGSYLPVTIKSAELEAFNGKIDGEGNYVQGSIDFAFGENNQATERYEVDRVDLDPSYDQEEFDNSYRDTPYLADVLR